MLFDPLAGAKRGGGKEETPAPSIGSRVRFNLDEQIMAGNMLVNTPSAI